MLDVPFQAKVTLWGIFLVQAQGMKSLLYPGDSRGCTNPDRIPELQTHVLSCLSSPPCAGLRGISELNMIKMIPDFPHAPDLLPVSFRISGNGRSTLAAARAKKPWSHPPLLFLPRATHPVRQQNPNLPTSHRLHCHRPELNHHNVFPKLL